MTRRPITGAERMLFQRQIELHASPRFWPNLKHELRLLSAGVLLALIAALLVRAALILTGLSPTGVAWSEDPVSRVVVPLVVAGILGWICLAIVSHARTSTRLGGTVMADAQAALARGEVTETVWEVEAVRRFEEPEHGMGIWFAKIGDRVRVVYDYGSGDPGDGSATVMPAGAQLVRVSLPETDLFDQRFAGAPLPVPDPVELSAPPERWPDDDSWTRIKWENLVARLG